MFGSLEGLAAGSGSGRTKVTWRWRRLDPSWGLKEEVSAEGGLLKGLSATGLSDVLITTVIGKGEDALKL